MIQWQKDKFWFVLFWFFFLISQGLKKLCQVSYFTDHLLLFDPNSNYFGFSNNNGGWKKDGK